MRPKPKPERGTTNHDSVTVRSLLTAREDELSFNIDVTQLHVLIGIFRFMHLTLCTSTIYMVLLLWRRLLLHITYVQRGETCLRWWTLIHSSSLPWSFLPTSTHISGCPTSFCRPWRTPLSSGTAGYMIHELGTSSPPPHEELFCHTASLVSIPERIHCLIFVLPDKSFNVVSLNRHGEMVPRFRATEHSFNGALENIFTDALNSPKSLRAFLRVHKPRFSEYINPCAPAADVNWLEINCISIELTVRRFIKNGKWMEGKSGTDPPFAVCVESRLKLGAHNKLSEAIRRDNIHIITELTTPTHEVMHVVQKKEGETFRTVVETGSEVNRYIVTSTISRSIKADLTPIKDGYAYYQLWWVLLTICEPTLKVLTSIVV
jgi:hypothetical protein